jgi:hypothetical protein
MLSLLRPRPAPERDRLLTQVDAEVSAKLAEMRAKELEGAETAENRRLSNK